jgi:hypothetical protein
MQNDAGSMQNAAERGPQARGRRRPDLCGVEFHAKHGAMQKIQVLLPGPILRDLREIAAAEDRPLSEVVRRAAEQMVKTYPAHRRAAAAPAAKVRTFDGGAVRARAAKLRALAYEDDRA